MADSFGKEREAIELETLSSLAANLVYRLPGCPDMVVRKTLEDVYRDFCRRSCCLRGRWRFDLKEGERRYPLFSDIAGVIDSVTSVRSGRFVLSEPYDYRADLRGIPEIVMSERTVPSEGRPRFGHCEAEFVVVPRIGSENAPKWLLDRYGDSMVSGVLARLMSMSGKPWTDTAQAPAEGMRYENGIGEARMEYHSGNGASRFDNVIDTGDLI